MTEDEYKEIQKLAAAAAKRVSFQWPSVIEAEDLAQDIVIRFLESPAAVAGLFEQPDTARRAFMVKVAHQVASQEMIDYDRFSGNYMYDTVEVRAYLDLLFGYPGTADGHMEMADLTEALGVLADKGSNHYAEVINRYEFGIVGATSTERDRTSRAVAALTEEMNRIGAERRKRRIEGPGTRRVVPNSTAQAITNIQSEQADASIRL